ncbi:hypothetical protein MMMB2_0265 [Mycobacterium marinum MB2]|nr:hypothetical protein MMMB2_0265 [Mycobacterium marinum MB2]
MDDAGSAAKPGPPWATFDLVADEWLGNPGLAIPADPRAPARSTGGDCR